MIEKTTRKIRKIISKKLPSKLFTWYIKKLVSNKRFTIISNDCWGGQIYRYSGIKYNTPFVGLMLMAPCYLKLLQDIKGYINTPLTFIKESKYRELTPLKKKYPIGLLKDIEIHFLHYDTEQDAIEKWERRIKRMDYDNLFAKFDVSKDLATEDHLRAFDNLELKKISFGNKPLTGYKSYVYIKDWSGDGAKMFLISMKNFDINTFLKKGEIKNTFFNKAISYCINRFIR